MKINVSDILEAIEAEYFRSNSIHSPKFVTTSEWLGVIREEHHEWEKEIFKQKGQNFANDSIREEAIQVAAMMLKGIMSLCKERTKCPSCEGKGFNPTIEDNLECRTCKGKGYLNEDEIPECDGCTREICGICPGVSTKRNTPEVTFKQTYSGEWSDPIIEDNPELE